VATAHRAENVDDPKRLASIFNALEIIAQEYPIVFSCHPRTRQRLHELDIQTSDRVTL
jgi:UDP-N-acetylglucosamine 2-epimerase